MQRFNKAVFAAVVALSFIFAGATKSSYGSTVNPTQKSKKSTTKKARKPATSKVSRTRSRASKRAKTGRKTARRRSSRRSNRRVARAATTSVRSGPSGIPAERVVEIQEALIKQGYLEAPSSGTYDEQTIAAMKAFQAANKLARTGLPSAHSLKKLGVAKRSKDGYAIPVSRVSEAKVKEP